jgi:hypothetical protein
MGFMKPYMNPTKNPIEPKLYMKTKNLIDPKLYIIPTKKLIELKLYRLCKV